MKIPSVTEAEAMLADASRRNPGPWVKHSAVAAATARAIAEHHPVLDPDAAYILGLLHDIGRSTGGPQVPDVRHLLDGYHLMLARGFDDSARICLTHSFPIKQADAFASRWDCPPEQKEFVQEYLEGEEYTPYDRLIQLCDALALPSGPVLMEKRLVDVALRHGLNDLTLAKWRAFLSLHQEFSDAVGVSIYNLLPGIVENTFAA
ncbi:MAG: HD domain-containing protein [Chloroflexota bacterium]